MASTSSARELRPKIAVSDDKAAHVAEVLKAVAHPLRIRLVAILCQREEHVNGLAEELGVPQAIVSQQLRILRLKNLVAATRENGFARYRLAEPHLKDLICCMEKCGGRTGPAGA